jgi:hypothetical protein
MFAKRTMKTIKHGMKSRIVRAPAGPSGNHDQSQDDEFERIYESDQQTSNVKPAAAQNLRCNAGVRKSL